MVCNDCHTQRTFKMDPQKPIHYPLQIHRKLSPLYIQSTKYQNVNKKSSTADASYRWIVYSTLVVSLALLQILPDQSDLQGLGQMPRTSTNTDVVLWGITKHPEVALYDDLLTRSSVDSIWIMYHESIISATLVILYHKHMNYEVRHKIRQQTTWMGCNWRFHDFRVGTANETWLGLALKTITI